MSDHHLLGRFVRRFLLEEVVGDRNLTVNTQRSYRDTIRVLLRYLAERHSADPAQLTAEQLTANVVREFLGHLARERGNSAATCNQRLAAIRSLFRFMAREVPELVDHSAQIQAIPLRRAAVPSMTYLEKPEVDAVLAVPDRRRTMGRRNHALLLFLYNTGARASEAAQLTVGALTLDPPPAVRFVGKGRKTRVCPLWPDTARLLRELLGPDAADGPADAPVFRSIRGQPLTRYGVYALVRRSVAGAAEKACPSLHGRRISPHTLRHTTATHLLRAGVDPNTIRAWLGHVSLETTNRYAEVDLETKARALEACAITVPDRTPTWRKDRDLMAFLTSL
ncbi:MAG: site-specific integrase [Deltaproteobacteria bacterium]|nr:site-specific integrase [Deltaproteobacteria bacterium]